MKVKDDRKFLFFLLLFLVLTACSEEGLIKKTEFGILNNDINEAEVSLRDEILDHKRKMEERQSGNSIQKTSDSTEKQHSSLKEVKALRKNIHKLEAERRQLAVARYEDRVQRFRNNYRFRQSQEWKRALERKENVSLLPGKNTIRHIESYQSLLD